MMRVLFLTPSYPPMLGGGARYAQALARHLSLQGHDITVITTQASRDADFWRGTRSTETVLWRQEERLQVARCAIRRMPAGLLGLLLWRKAMIALSALPGDQSGILRRMARRIPNVSGMREILQHLKDYDIVHAWNLSWEYPVIEGWRVARERRVPLVITPFAHLGTGVGDRVARNNTMDHQCRLLRDADAVLALTSLEKEGLVALGIEAARVHVVGGGMDTAPQDGLRYTARETLERFRLAPPVILFIGRVSRDKGAIQACEAMRLLRAQGMRVSLALVGEVAPDFERYFRSLGADGRAGIYPLGAVDDATKHALLAACEMLVLPSRVDSFGLVLLEAWSHGKPVIGARAGGLPAVIEEGQDGLLVPYGDARALARAIIQLLHNPIQARELGRQGQLKVLTHYTWDAICEQHIRIYRQLLRGHGSASSKQGGGRCA